MALGVKRLSTIEKGDIVIARTSIKIYELQDDGSLAEVDNVVKNDTIGFFTGDIVSFNSNQYVEFVTPDAVLADSSPDFMRIRRYMLWDTDFDYQVNPNYNYPDRKAETRIFDVIVNYTKPQKLYIIAGILSVATLIVLTITYFVKKSKKPKRLRGANK